MTECVTVEQVVALYKYQKQNHDELTFEKGCVINVISKLDSDWWTGELNGQTGLFPSNYVAPLSSISESDLPSVPVTCELFSIIIIHFLFKLRHSPQSIIHIPVLSIQLVSFSRSFSEYSWSPHFSLPIRCPFQCLIGYIDTSDSCLMLDYVRIINFCFIIIIALSSCISEFNADVVVGFRIFQ